MIDKILKEFNKAITKLEKYESKLQTKRASVKANIMSLQDEEVVLKSEAKRAKDVLNKIKNLIQ